MKLLNEILGTRYPIIQGGMANIATGEFAAACSNAGALGLIGSGGMNADSLRDNIRRAKQLTDKPFGVNIMLMHPQADEFAKIVVEEDVRFVTTGAGNPGKYMESWKTAGITVMPVVAASVLAKHLVKCGCRRPDRRRYRERRPCGRDGHHGPGTPGGGCGGRTGGGGGRHCDGRQLAAAFALGACGAQIGTCLLVSEECPIHPNYKAALLKAKDSDTIVTGRIGGTPVRF